MSIIVVDNLSKTYPVAELSEMLSLQEKLTQPVRKLSLGERMKTELLAALLHHLHVERFEIAPQNEGGSGVTIAYLK